MAFDVARKRQDDKDWSLNGDWAFDAVVDRAKKTIPLKVVGIGAAAGLLWLFWPKKKTLAEEHRWDERTKEIPRQTMSETIHAYPVHTPIYYR